MGQEMLKRKLFFLYLFLFLARSLFAAPIIKEIVIVGNKRVKKDLIIHEIKSKPGSPFSRKTLSEDIKALFALGYFLDVQADVRETPEGVIITFAVIEKPTVEDVVISGCERLKREDVEGVIKVKKGDFLDLKDVRASQEAIRRLYTSKGYYGNEVTYEVSYRKGNKTVVYFDIVEGPKGYIKKIEFVGNKAFSSRKLRGLMRTKRKTFLSWLTKTGTLERDVLEVDLARIREFYRDRGYVTVKVKEPKITLSRDRRSIVITIEIEEGDRYRVGSVDIVGDILGKKEDLLKKLKVKKGKWYRSSLVHKDVLWLTDRYADQGYAYVDVSPLTSLDKERKLVHLLYKIEEGKLVYINRINIRGNTKTRDKVIRREIKVAEGELYSSTRIRESRRRLVKTGYFKDVDLSVSPTERKELVDLDVKVEEMQTGTLQFGAGYSSVYGAVGTISLSERNLFGRGYKVYARATLGGELIDFSLGATDPRFLDGPFSLGFDAFNVTHEFDTYDYRTTGGDIKVGREITDTIRADFTYLYERIKVFNVDDEASDYIKSQRGTTLTSKVTLTLSRDTVNNPFFPTSGSEVWISGSNAGGPLGGDNYFYKFSGGFSWFHPLIGDLVLNLKGNVGIVRGYSGREVPLREKFYVGGMNTVRGFEYGMAGPVDENQEPIGALNMVTFSTELLYPLSKALGLRLAVFYDVGKGFDHWSDVTPLRHGAGVGIRWYSPLGPIRIDWGYNLDRKPERGEKASAWDFSIGVLY